MSTSYDLWLMYGFPVTHTTLLIPTKLGKRAPSLYDWFVEWRDEHPDTQVMLDHFGWLNDDSYKDVPFIGVPIGSEKDIRRGEIPGTLFGSTPGWIEPPTDEDEALLWLQETLGCDGDDRYSIGFYMMLKAG